VNERCIKCILSNQLVIQILISINCVLAVFFINVYSLCLQTADMSVLFPVLMCVKKSVGTEMSVVSTAVMIERVFKLTCKAVYVTCTVNIENDLISDAPFA